MSALAAYQSKYESARLRREDGILEVALTTAGGPLVWGEVPHRELPALWLDIAADPDNRVVILTGTGDAFCAEIDVRSWTGHGITRASGYDKLYAEGRRLLQALLEIEAPIIAAVNGPARVHGELAAMSDIVLAADTAVFQDMPHFRRDAVPGDGAHVVWPYLLGLNRGRYFLMMNQELSARQALELGVVGEIHPAGAVLERAWQIARELTTLSDLTLRYTRQALLQPLREAVLRQLGPGLMLEGAAMAAVASRPPPA